MNNDDGDHLNLVVEIFAGWALTGENIGSYPLDILRKMAINQEFDLSTRTCAIMAIANLAKEKDQIAERALEILLGIPSDTFLDSLIRTRSVEIIHKCLTHTNSNIVHSKSHINSNVHLNYQKALENLLFDLSLEESARGTVAEVIGYLSQNDLFAFYTSLKCKNTLVNMVVDPNATDKVQEQAARAFQHLGNIITKEEIIEREANEMRFGWLYAAISVVVLESPSRVKWIESLVNAVSNQELDPKNRGNAALALSYFGKFIQQKEFEILKKMATSPDEDVFIQNNEKVITYLVQDPHAYRLAKDKVCEAYVRAIQIKGESSETFFVSRLLTKLFSSIHGTYFPSTNDSVSVMTLIDLMDNEELDDLLRRRAVITLGEIVGLNQTITPAGFDAVVKMASTPLIVKKELGSINVDYQREACNVLSSLVLSNDKLSDRALNTLIRILNNNTLSVWNREYAVESLFTIVDSKNRIGKEGIDALVNIALREQPGGIDFTATMGLQRALDNGETLDLFNKESSFYPHLLSQEFLTDQRLTVNAFTIMAYAISTVDEPIKEQAIISGITTLLMKDVYATVLLAVALKHIAQTRKNIPQETIETLVDASVNPELLFLVKMEVIDTIGVIAQTGNATDQEVSRKAVKALLDIALDCNEHIMVRIEAENLLKKFSLECLVDSFQEKPEGLINASALNGHAFSYSQTELYVTDRRERKKLSPEKLSNQEDLKKRIQFVEEWRNMCFL